VAAPFAGSKMLSVKDLWGGNPTKHKSSSPSSPLRVSMLFSKNDHELHADTHFYTSSSCSSSTSSDQSDEEMSEEYFESKYMGDKLCRRIGPSLGLSGGDPMGVTGYTSHETSRTSLDTFDRDHVFLHLISKSSGRFDSLSDGPTPRIHKINFGMGITTNLGECEESARILITTSLKTMNDLNNQPIEYEWTPIPEKEIEVLEMSLHIPSDVELPADASFWFHLMTKQKSSEGYSLYENAGAGRIMIADVLKSTTCEDIVLYKGKSDGMIWNSGTSRVRHTVSVTMPHPDDNTLPKATVLIEMRDDASVNTARSGAISFRAPAPYDWTPGNHYTMELVGYLAVENDMCIFYGGENGHGDKVPKVLTTISPELDHVHAPYYATGLTNLPGFVYFANLTDQHPPDEKVFQTLIENVLKRHRMSKEEFVATCNSFLEQRSPLVERYKERGSRFVGTKESETDNDKERQKIQKVCAMIMEISSQVANALPYIGDFEVDIVADTEDEPEKSVSVKTRILEKLRSAMRGRPRHMSRSTYGNRNRHHWRHSVGDDLSPLENKASLRAGSFHKTFSRVHTDRHGDESFDDPMRKKSGDCEDLASLIMRVFRHLQENEWKSPELKAAQAISQHYCISAALVSVTARNLKEGHHYKTDEVVINSERDRSANFGAHMTTIATPLFHLGAIVDRNNGKAFSTGEIKLPSGVSAGDPMVQRSKELPVLVGEGTGALFALPLAPEAYVNTTKAKMRVTEEAIKQKDADARLQTGMSMGEIQKAGGSARKLPGFSSIETIKEQKQLFNHKNIRFSPFFRDISALFFTPPHKEEPVYTGLHSSECRMPTAHRNITDSTKDIDPAVLASMMSWRVVRPVQIGVREEDKKAPSSLLSSRNTYIQKEEKTIKHGVPMTDFVNKRKHVGALLTPPETLNMNRVMASTSRHLLPLAPFEEMSSHEKANVLRTSDQIQMTLDKFVNKPKGRERVNFSAQHLEDFRRERALTGDSSRRHTLSSFSSKRGSQRGGEDIVMEILTSEVLSEEQREYLKTAPISIEQVYKRIVEPDLIQNYSELFKGIADNKYVLGAIAHPEPLCNNMGYVRVDIAIDTTHSLIFSSNPDFEDNPAI